MNFSLDKKGYNTKEVDEFLKKLTDNYESALLGQKQRISELKAALSKSEKIIKNYKEKTDIVSKAIYNAVAKADEIERLTQIKYNQEIEQLKAFHEKWMNYYNRILEQYPLDDDLVQASKFNSQMKSILSRTKPLSMAQSPKSEAPAFDSVKNLQENYEAESVRIKNSPPQKKDAVKKDVIRKQSVDLSDIESESVQKQIGYIKVTTFDKQKADDDVLREMLPDGDLNSPIASGDFSPIERINRYYNAEKQNSEKQNSERQNSEKQNSGKQGTEKVNQTPQRKAEDESVISSSYKDRSNLGFSFEEALNPKEDLEQIMRDLGLLIDEHDKNKN